MSKTRTYVVMASAAMLLCASMALSLGAKNVLAQQTNSTTNSTAAAPGNATSPAGGNSTAHVSIVLSASTLGAKAYSPNPLNITTGTTVVWTNDDTQIHTVTSGNGSGDPNMGKVFDSGLTGASALKTKGSSFSYTFASPGTYQYFCQVHPTMVGTVNVTSGTSAVPEFPSAVVMLGATVAILGGVVLMTRFKAGGSAFHL